MTNAANITNFTVSYSPDHDAYLVHEVSSAFSFAMIPAHNQAEFSPIDYKNAKSLAFEQVRRLHAWQRKGNKIETRMTETPSRFEAVADTKYGCAW